MNGCAAASLNRQVKLNGCISTGGQLYWTLRKNSTEKGAGEAGRERQLNRAEAENRTHTLSKVSFRWLSRRKSI